MRRGLCKLLLSFLLVAGPSAQAAGPPQELIIPLDDGLLKRFEVLSTQLSSQLRADKALKADFKSVENDKAPPDGAPSTLDGLSALMASRHPRLTAALAADGWKPGEFYGVLGTLVGAEVGVGTLSPKEKHSNKGFEKNVAFVEAHKARVDAALDRLNKGMGLE